MSNLFYESLTLTEDDNYENIFHELAVKTNNWSDPAGEVRYSDKTSADVAASILEERYGNVKIEPLDYEDGKDLSYHITFSDNFEEDFDQDGLNWMEDKNPIGTPLGGGTGMGEDYEPGDDEIQCPICGGSASYVEAQGFYEFYKCLDCGEYIAKDTKGKIMKADDAFDEKGDVLTEDNGNDSFEAAQEYYASLEKPEQTAKVDELNNHFKELGLDIVDFNQTIPSKDNNMYFNITKLDGGEEVAKYEKAIVAELEKLGAKNIDISQAINYNGKAYIHGGFFLDGMSLEEDKSEDSEINEAIEKHDELNQKLFDGEELKPEVKDKLLEIVEKFKDNLAQDDVKLDIKDVIIIGSSASYNYTKDSDIDLHIVADLSVYPNQEELAGKLYTAYKALFNNKYDPTIYGVPVEVYVEPYKGDE